jgi:hypothetical protein
MGLPGKELPKRAFPEAGSALSSCQRWSCGYQLLEENGSGGAKAEAQERTRRSLQVEQGHGATEQDHAGCRDPVDRVL